MVKVTSLAVSLLLTSAGIVAQASTPTTIAVTPSSTTATLGAPVTLTAVVSPSGATGMVTFYDGVIVLGTGSLASGAASLTTDEIPSGVQSLRAHYSGNSTYAASTSAATTLSVYALPADGFQTPAYYPAQAPMAIAAGDMNGDGYDDLVVGSSGGISVLLNNGHGAFLSPVFTSLPGYTPPFVQPESIAIADFNHDGNADVAVDGVVLLGLGNGNFEPPIKFSSGGAPVLVADFNMDGIPDISSGGLWLGKGDGTFTAAPETVGPPYPSFSGPALAVADFNGDGIPDLLSHDFVEAGGFPCYCGPDLGTWQIAYGKGDGTFTYTQNTPEASDGYSFGYTGDFNGDGKPDFFLTTAESAAPAFYLNNGNGTFQPAASTPALDQAEIVPIGDFNGDGILDVLSLGDGSGAGTLLGNGNGTFQDGTTYPGFSTAQVVSGVDQGGIFDAVVGDFNGDGRTDVAVALKDYNGTGAVAVILGKAYTPTTTSTTLTPSVNPAFSAESITLTANVSPASATGTVSFFESGSFLGTVALSAGKAILTVGALAPGAYQLTARYDGDLSAANNGAGSLAPSVSPVLDETVRAEQNPGEYYAHTFTGNLLENPDAQRGLKGWWPDSSQSTTVTVTPSGQPADHAFLGAAYPQAFISQTLDLTDAGISPRQIDSGDLAADFSFSFADQSPGSGAVGRTGMTFFDKNMARTGQGLAGRQTDPSVFSWSTSKGSFAIPPGTRYIVFTMDFYTSSASTNSGLITGNVLKIADTH